MPLDKSITCSKHGNTSATYVCEHLVDNPAQRWFCDYPSEDNLWPDAWCQTCEDQFQTEGEWNEKNKSNTNIKILCSSCYETGLSTSLDFLEQKILDSWEQLIHDCHHNLCEKQKILNTDYSISKHKRWDYDQATGLLTFSNDGIPAVIADIEMIGSFSTKSNTWLWSWANFHILANVRAKIETVRTFGETYEFPRLTIPKWRADEVLGWEVSTVAAHILDAKGIYRVPSESGFLFMALTNIRCVS